LSTSTSTIAAPLQRRLQASTPVVRFQALPVPLRIALVVAFLTGFSLALRTQALHGRYWIDEGLSVGISSHPLSEIPGLLRQDGSPPLYYLILGVWMRIFGHGEADTHILSVGFAVLVVPAAFLAGRELFGARAGWYAALLAAMNPFLTYYAQETRMYALAVLLSVVVTAAFSLAFVQRRRAWLPVFSVALAMMMYTHNWGLFMAAGSIVAFVAVVRTERDGVGLVRDGLLAYGAVALLYLPWLPTLIFQIRHTGAPWSGTPSPQEALAAVTALLGGAAPAMAFGLAAATGLVTLPMAARGARSPRARATMAVAIMGVTTLLLAWLAAQVSPGWALRYLAVMLGPLLLLGATGLARAGPQGAFVVLLLVVFWANPRMNLLNTKSNAHDAAVVVEDRLEPGDLVVATHPEQLPVMHVYLPRRLRWANAMGPVADPTLMDWRDVVQRLERARPTPTSDAMVRSLRPGQHLLLVQPIIRTAKWGAPWTSLVRRRAAQWERVLDDDPRLARTLASPKLRGRRLPRGVRTVLYERL
jgi:mannosyltransferase